MAYKLTFLPEAKGDVKDVKAYLSKFYAGTSGRFIAQLKKQTSLLKNNPCMYEQYVERPAYRKMSVNDYLVFYKVNDYKKIIEIHRILHSSRDISRFLDE